MHINMYTVQPLVLLHASLNEQKKQALLPASMTKFHLYFMYSIFVDERSFHIDIESIKWKCICLI